MALLSEHLQRLIAFGLLGLLIEVFFTGVKSIFRKRFDAPARTNLPVFFVYGIGGMSLEILNDNLHWHIFIKAIPLTLLIYWIEFWSGLLFEKVYGRCFWKYTESETSEVVHRFSVLGLIRIDYSPYWYILSIFFIHFSPKMKLIINNVSRL